MHEEAPLAVQDHAPAVEAPDGHAPVGQDDRVAGHHAAQEGVRLRGEGFEAVAVVEEEARVACAHEDGLTGPPGHHEVGLQLGVGPARQLLDPVLQHLGGALAPVVHVEAAPHLPAHDEVGVGGEGVQLPPVPAEEALAGAEHGPLGGGQHAPDVGEVLVPGLHQVVQAHVPGLARGVRLQVAELVLAAHPYAAPGSGREAADHRLLAGGHEAPGGAVVLQDAHGVAHVHQAPGVLGEGPVLVGGPVVPRPEGAQEGGTQLLGAQGRPGREKEEGPAPHGSAVNQGWPV